MEERQYKRGGTSHNEVAEKVPIYNKIIKINKKIDKI
jgi:hypothetical protein